MGVFESGKPSWAQKAHGQKRRQGIMNEYKLTFLPDQVTATVPEGTTILDAAHTVGVDIPAPCGGKGLCGKCMVIISDGTGHKSVRACEYKVECDLEIRLQHKETGNDILMDGAGRKVAFNPMCVVADVLFPRGEVGDYDNDSWKLCMAIAEKVDRRADELELTMSAIRELELQLMKDNFTFKAVVVANKVVHVTNEDVHPYVAAFDIGTTTVVGYLIDSLDGTQKAVTSMMNPQEPYGADVISRANYTTQEDPDKLTQIIRGGISSMLDDLVKQVGISRQDLYLLTVVGNTCMHHLFCGIVPSSLIRVPYTAAVNAPLLLEADNLGIEMAPGGCVQMLPVFAGFVGADTNACLIAIDFVHEEKRTLMLDIGTNGELVMGTKDKAFASSTAAGPALEGAKIEFGMRGADGAIDHVSAEGDELVCHVIGGGKAQGICGSGILDIIALLLDKGMIAPGGRLVKADKLEGSFAQANAWRLESNAQGGHVMLQDGIYLSQKDIREVQLAKSAIAVGINILSRKLGWEIEDIEQVKIAGAFGNYMDPKSACTIGLIPMELLDRVIPIGNAAGEGAKIALVDFDEMENGRALSKEIPFVELATESDFQELFVENLSFKDDEDE